MKFVFIARQRVKQRRKPMPWLTILGCFDKRETLIRYRRQKKPASLAGFFMLGTITL
jgi:hypothetical protein